jgi:hypothetical protein
MAGSKGITTDMNKIDRVNSVCRRLAFTDASFKRKSLLQLLAWPGQDCRESCRKFLSLFAAAGILSALPVTVQAQTSTTTSSNPDIVTVRNPFDLGIEGNQKNHTHALYYNDESQMVLFVSVLFPEAFLKAITADQPIETDPGFTPAITDYTVPSSKEEISTVVVPGWLDPLSHYLFVQKLPAEAKMTSVTVDGEPALRLEYDSSGAHWGNMDLEISANAKVTGLSKTTVAGYPDVTTKFEGTLTPAALSGDFTVGAGGELPGGGPIVFTINMTTDQDQWHFMTPMTTSLIPETRLTINEVDTGELLISRGSPVSIKVGLDANGNRQPADWWLVATVDHSIYYHFDLASKSWQQGLKPTYQGNLFNLNDIELSAFPNGLPVPSIDLFFGVDMEPNGVIDEAAMIATSVRYLWHDSPLLAVCVHSCLNVNTGDKPCWPPAGQ